MWLSVCPYVVFVMDQFCYCPSVLCVKVYWLLYPLSSWRHPDASLSRIRALQQAENLQHLFFPQLHQKLSPAIRSANESAVTSSANFAVSPCDILIYCKYVKKKQTVFEILQAMTRHLWAREFNNMQFLVATLLVSESTVSICSETAESLFDICFTWFSYRTPLHETNTSTWIIESAVVCKEDTHKWVVESHVHVLSLSGFIHASHKTKSIFSETPEGTDAGVVLDINWFSSLSCSSRIKVTRAEFKPQDINLSRERIWINQQLLCFIHVVCAEEWMLRCYNWAAEKHAQLPVFNVFLEILNRLLLFLGKEFKNKTWSYCDDVRTV